MSLRSLLEAVPQQKKKEEKKSISVSGLDPKTVEWWNSRSAESQKAHVKAHPDAPVSQLVQAGKLRFGEKIGAGGKTGNRQQGAEEPLKVPYTVSKHKLSDKELEISGDHKKNAHKMAKHVEDHSDKEFHIGKSEPGSFGDKATKSSIAHVLKAIDDGERDIEKLAELVHRGWCKAVEDHYPPEEPISLEEPVSTNTEKQIKESKIRNLLMEAPTKLDKKTIAWWNSRSAEEQKKHVDAHPDALVAKLVKSGELKYGQKIPESEPPTSAKPGEATTVESPEEQGKKIARQKLAGVPYEKLPETEKEKDRLVAKKILDLHKENVKKEKEKEENENVTKIKGTPASETVIIEKKNKTLRKVKTSTTTVWNRRNTRSIEEISKHNKNYKGENISIPGKQYKIPTFVGESGKFPKKYTKVIETMMNTRTVGENSGEPPITHFIGTQAGKGIIKAQAGEILTMMSVTMNDNDFKDFKNSMIEHMKETRDAGDDKFVITKSWVDAAEDQRKAIFNRISREYKTKEPHSIIENSCWDSKDEVEALGLTDYDKNKAKSSDIYLKIKTDKGEFLNEISLKKSSKAKLLNARTSRLHEWDKNLPKDADIREYASVQRTKLKDMDSETITNVLNQYNIPEVNDVHEEMKKHKLTVDEIMKGASVDSRRILKKMQGALATLGDPKAEKILKEIDEDEKRYQEAVVRELSNNDKVKKKLLEEIGDELPLKNTFNKEVSVAMGDMSIDEEILKNIFDVKKWEHMKEHIKSYRGKPPYVGYELESSKEVIPIANIAMREYGKGFSGAMRFELTIHKDFEQRLKGANKQVYDDENEYKNENRVVEWLKDRDKYVLTHFRIDESRSSESYYHFTTETIAMDIKQHGFKSLPKSGFGMTNLGDGVYFYTDPRWLQFYAYHFANKRRDNNTFAIVEADIPKTFIEGSEGEDGYIVRPQNFDKIKIKNIKKVARLEIGYIY